MSREPSVAADQTPMADTETRQTIRSRLPRRDLTGLAGALLTALMLLLALFPAQFSPHDPLRQDILQRLQPPVWSGGTTAHILGTDALGRDVLSRVVHGSRISLLVGVAAVIVSGLLGVALGLLAGFLGGLTDTVVMRLVDIQLAIPTLILALTIIAVFGPGLGNVIVVLGVTGWVIFARVVRGEVLAVRERDFVVAARALGASNLRNMARHVLPNVASSIIVIASLRVGIMIILEATLSFLGLGIQPPTPTWGTMISEGRDLIYLAPWVSVYPGVALGITVLGLNLLGDWLRDRLDPQLRN